MMENAVTRSNETEYVVKSQTGNGEYRVSKNYKGWYCSCPDYSFRGLVCKHIYAVQFSQEMRQVVAKRKKPLVLEPVSITQCQFCGSSKIKKYGIRNNKSGAIQRFICEYCKRTFSVNVGFERMKHNPQAITTAMQLYFSGESLRNTQKSLRLLGVQVCHRTVYKWIQKYSELMQAYADKIRPNVSSTWRTDEIYIKVKGDQKYLFALMDDETRYWISQQVADHKGTSNIRPMMQEAKEITRKEPSTIISDGAQNFGIAIGHEFPAAKHTREITLAGTVHNNKMERMNGEIRDREKTMRGLKTKETPILTGLQIFHNFIRPHAGLNGSTPAEKAGIEIKGENKWKTLIENASIGKHQPKVSKKKMQNLEDFV